MKIICLQEKLREALRITERIAGKNVNLPILSNVLIRTEKNKITISSTDLEMAITCTIPGKIEEEGKAAIPAKLISTFVHNLVGAKKITLESKKHNILLKTEHYKAQILGSDPEEFPIIPQPKKGERIPITTKEFISGLEKVVRIAGVSEMRPEITGVFLKTDSSAHHLILASTDSFRLTEKKIPLGDIKNDFSFILPSKSVNEIIRVFSGGDEKTTLLAGDQNQVVVNNENCELVSRLIDGEFPRYDEIVPRDTSFHVSFSSSVLVPKIKAISAFSNRSNDITFDFFKDRVELAARESSSGEGATIIPFAKSIKLPGEHLSIAFNWKFLLDGLESMGAKEVVFGINSEIQPVILTSPEDPLQFYLVMPIKNG